MDRGELMIRWLKAILEEKRESHYVEREELEKIVKVFDYAIVPNEQQAER